MELKGELKRGGLPALFRNFATENFSGVLTITSPVGEKLITLTENEVTIYCDELNETSRLGNILLAREKITLDSLEATLRDQKKIDPRPMLGDMLIRRGLVTQQDCIDARRFQIEEDIGDILSWKNARFHFAGRESAREIRPEDFAFEQVHRLAIDPESFFKSVTKFTEDWESINDRLPTQYLCFKVSPKAEEAKSRLTKNAQRVLRFLTEGRTIEGAVKQSCLGRIETCVQVIELLEKGLIVPASGADLRFQASEHRAQKRYHDALYIYRRLMESPDTKDERQYLENLIGEISAQIIHIRQTGGFGEEAVVLSHRGAKEKFKRKRLFQTVAIGIVAAVLVVAGAAVLINRARITDDPLVYKQTLLDVEAAEKAHDFKKLAGILNTYYASLNDKDGDVARNILDHINRLPGDIDKYVKAQLPDFEEGLKCNGDDLKKAIAGLRKLKEEYPNNSSTKRIDELVAQGEKKIKDAEAATKAAATEPKEVPRSQLVAQMNVAMGLMQELKYRGAERELEEITRLAPTSDSLWKQADEVLKSIQIIKARAKGELEKANEELKANQGDKAVAILAKAKIDYPDLEITNQITAQEIKLVSRKRQALDSLTQAKEEDAQGKTYAAINRLKMLVDTYAEFPTIIADARKFLSSLETKNDAVRKDLLAALEAVEKTDFRTARTIYKKLMEKNYQLLVDQKIDLPVFVTSIPPGSPLKLNGESSGVTPQNVLIPAGKPFELLIERPGFKPFRIAKNNITSEQLEISVPLVLEPIVIEMKFPLYAPAVAFEGKPLLPCGPALYSVNPPSLEPTIVLSGLFSEKESIPEGQSATPGEEKYFWHCRQSPQPFLPGKFLLPLRNREILELDLANPGARTKTQFLRPLPAEVTGRIYFDEHSRLAGRAVMLAAFADGMIRGIDDADRYKGRAPKDSGWSISMDPNDKTNRDGPVCGLHAYKNLVHVLSPSGILTAIDPVERKEAWHQKFGVMSPRACFGETPNDNLAALVHRDGKVIIFDLADNQNTQGIWQLGKRQAMQESVGALVTNVGIFITTANNDSGELKLYQRNGVDGQPKELWTASLQGHADLDMARGKHIYLVTHLNRVFAFDIANGRQRWEYKMEPELGRPLWIRAIGDYVYVGTQTGKLLVLKAD